jgi:hypothetical protein
VKTLAEPLKVKHGVTISLRGVACVQRTSHALASRWLYQGQAVTAPMTITMPAPTAKERLTQAE